MFPAQVKIYLLRYSPTKISEARLYVLLCVYYSSNTQNASLSHLSQTHRDSYSRRPRNDCETLECTLKSFFRALSVRIWDAFLNLYLTVYFIISQLLHWTYELKKVKLFILIPGEAYSDHNYIVVNQELLQGLWWNCCNLHWCNHDDIMCSSLILF